ncbi:MAG: transposase [Candidatus Thermoplasmatota archaeon]|jgi:transposase|nr:transposase [Candidatus Thermoplasmatota archaeon]
MKYWERWYSWIIYSSIEAMKGAARMMKVHLGSMMNYFIHRITNERAGGINAMIALIERVAFGYMNRKHLKKCNTLHV